MSHSCRRILLVVLAVMLSTVLVGSNALAAQPRYAYTSIVAAGLSFSGGNAECFGEIVADSSSSSISMKVRLWRKVDGVWSVIKTWSASTTSYPVCTIDKDYSVSAGTYKVTVAGTVTTASGAKENVTCNSSSKTYP